MTTQATDFVLYHTLGCHLCEEAEAIVTPLAEALACTVSRCDIADSEALVDAYGIRIPVLKAIASGAELSWPFSPETARAFMEMQCRSSSAN